VTSLWYRDVTLGRQGAVALLTLLIAQSVLSTHVSAQTIIIPSLSVSETYDSNVFFTPKSLLAPNQKPEDFLTRVTPQINMAHANSLMSSSLSVGGLVTKYLHNSNLDYTGINAAGLLDLTNAANQVSQRITSLTVRGTYQFAPSSSGFGAAPGVGTGTGIGVGGQNTLLGGALNNGLVTNRVSTHRYTLGVGGGYQLTPTTTLNGTYNYSKIFFGNQSGGVNNPLFNTTGHQGSTTISTQISARDTVGATATLSHFIQEQSSGSSGQGSFTTVSETLNWRRLWTQELSTSLAVGGILTPPIGSSIPGQSVKSQFGPTATALMTYSSFSEELRAAGSSGPFDSLPSLAGSLNPGGIMNPGAYTATLRYTYSLFPSYAFGAGPTKTHVVGANVTGGIARNLTAQAGINFAHGSRSNPDTSFDSVGVVGGLGYLMGPVLANLTGNWLYFTNSTTQSGSQSQYEFSKKMIMLSFSFAFTSPSQSFFRMGGFGSSGKQGSVEGISAPSGAGTGSSPSGDGSGSLRKE
jgi:hypothetical protein